MDFHIHIGPLIMDLFLLYLRGLSAKSLNINICLSLKSAFILANSADPDEMSSQFAKIPAYRYPE